MIGVVSFPEDPHAQRVIEHLRADGADVVLLDLSELPDRATLTLDYDGGAGERLELHRDGQPVVDLAQATAMWWRRPQAADPATVLDPETRLFTVNEWQEAINGLWQLIDARWVNDPARDDVAARKALQLRLAGRLGLRVPRTLITSDPARASAFIDAQGVGKTIYKTFSCTHTLWRETRLVRDDVLPLLESVRLAPVIFQEYVPAGVDLRVTVVGRRLFAASIDSRQTDYPVDFRASLGQARVKPADLPSGVQAALLALMDELALGYAAIDLRRTPEGEHVFLELNTAGEFLFIEERTGQPISRELASLLATPA